MAIQYLTALDINIQRPYRGDALDSTVATVPSSSGEWTLQPLVRNVRSDDRSLSTEDSSSTESYGNVPLRPQYPGDGESFMRIYTNIICTHMYFSTETYYKPH